MPIQHHPDIRRAIAMYYLTYPMPALQIKILCARYGTSLWIAIVSRGGRIAWYTLGSTNRMRHRKLPPREVRAAVEAGSQDTETDVAPPPPMEWASPVERDQRIEEQRRGLL